MKLTVTGSILFLLFLTGCNQYKTADQVSGADLSSYSLENCHYIRNSNGQIVSWKSLVPIKFHLSKYIPEIWRETIQDAAKSWTTPSGTQLIQIDNELSSSENTLSDRKNIIYWIDSGALFKYQQAQTITRWSRNQIQDADILINSKDFSYYAENPDNDRQIHLKSLLIHEFGHALGLKHIAENKSVMYPELGFLHVRINLAKADQTSMKCEYP